MCGKMPYSSTSLPNTFGHETQEEIGLEIHQFWPLVEMQCSPFLEEFLCSVYIPPCGHISSTTCKELCESARDGCQSLLKQFGFVWPGALACESLPSLGEDTTCFLGGLQDGTSSGRTFTLFPKMTNRS
ncbi:hypothetical protein BSL78_10243 [Apostichopus japonicus]|uniref:FZ domain-containing protein n=1 Tax=Stichopus japonicus TaxID=307972 RepID=A0A2G8KXZ6_STIJA|nr:hypothetical protein BSL78_10243 [Apostichopus japonicus]